VSEGCEKCGGTGWDPYKAPELPEERRRCQHCNPDLVVSGGTFKLAPPRQNLFLHADDGSRVSIPLTRENILKAHELFSEWFEGVEITMT
jgi:hypothetical protein